MGEDDVDVTDQTFDHEAVDCPVRLDVSAIDRPKYLHGDCANYVPGDVDVFLRDAERYFGLAAELMVPGQRVDVIQRHVINAELALLHAKIAAFKADRRVR